MAVSAKLIPEKIYPAQFQTLKAIVEAIGQSREEPARQLLARAFETLDTLTSGPQRLQMQLFLEALDTRLNHAGEVANLYMVPDAGQQIRMFNFMAEKFPVVTIAQDIVNGLFLERVCRDERFVLLDIGLGTGQQAAHLIERLVANRSAVKEAVILGIEPSADSLAKARTRFEELARDLGIAINFTAIEKTAEQLDEADWAVLCEHMAQTDGKLLINASFALHHTSPVSFRLPLFKRLKALEPDGLMIIEPYADFTSDDLMQRFYNAWHHYGLTFMAIDTIDASEEEKSTVKRVFFGREMPDVLGNGNRVELYETTEMWLEQLEEAGFCAQPIAYALTEAFNPLITVQSNRQYLSFNVQGHPIVGVICAC